MNASRPDPRPVAMLVLGMHRSGTSATSGSLRLLGVELGDCLIEAADDNPKGYWEHALAVDIHDRLLAGLSRSWDDVRRLPDGWQQHQACEAARSAIRDVVAEFAGASFWALKDPRISRFTPLWLAELKRSRFVPACLFVVRHPEEVAASLLARNGFPHFVSHLLWIRHVLEAARDTVHAPRALITYDTLLEDPCACLDRVARTLGLEWPVGPDEARHELTEFLDRAEQHQFSCSGTKCALDTSSLSVLVSDIYARCVEISEGSAGWDALNRFQQDFDAFDIANHGWIEALGGLQQAEAVMRSRVSQRLQAQIGTLETELGALDVAKAAAESLAHERLDVLDRADLRIAAAERSSLDRLSESQRLTAALAEAEKLGRDRLEEVQDLSAQLDEVNALALARLDELHARAKAHEMAEQLAFDRLAETQRLTASLAEAEKLGRDRLEEIQRLSAKLDEANALALGRLDEVHVQAKAHETAGRLAIERLAELERLTAALNSVTNLALAREAKLRSAEQDIAGLRGELQRVTGSLSWKLGRPARAADMWIRGKGKGKETR